MLLEYDGLIAIITHNRPEKHNAASDELGARPFEIIEEPRTNQGARAVIWNANENPGRRVALSDRSACAPKTPQQPQGLARHKRFDTTRIDFGEDADPKAETQASRERLLASQNQVANKRPTK